MANHVLYQHSTLGTLMAGALEGTATIDELLQQGDHGIGTLEGGDGEVIFIDGKAFHSNAKDGKVVPLTGSEKSPYATVTKYDPETFFKTEGATIDELYDTIRSKMLSENLFSVVKVKGAFKHMKMRILPKQEPPYTRLIESARKQPEFERDNVDGTIVAIFTPEIYHGIGTAGFHAHFMSDDGTFMGHILDFEIEHGEIGIQNCHIYEQHLPTDPTYLNKKLDYNDIANDITEAE
ncbi:acetolactate decarboxylase [Staphylococcus canis]|uniref:acetolactate decarboxylase n=1 Tax=Staphylococcus canis TaxID=2724942 RepID=UPI0032E7FD62